MRLRRPLVLATLAAAAAFAACTLNPQPLPPSDDPNRATGGIDGGGADAGSFKQPEAAQDAGTAPNDGEGGAADADTDAGDASSDADADADAG